jgi:predicted NAD-dependent protein-ADP-ribosyltransferase YbiA (DUF1768 family)
MVKSRIHDKVEYDESRKMYEDDKKHDTVVYSCTLLDTVYRIALGKQRSDMSHLGMYYFPIYLISNRNKIKGKVGVFEIEASRVNSIRDKDQDVIISLLGKPLLFPYVTTEYLTTFGKKHVEEVKDDEKDKKDDKPGKKEEETSDEIFSVPKRKNKKSPPKTDFLKKEDVFEKKDTKIVEKLTPETLEDAERIRKNYKNKTTDSWITKTMKNPNYTMVQNSGGGECFFHAVVQGVATIGMDTSVEKLRKTLSQELDIGQVDIYRNLHKMLQEEKKNLEEKIKLNKEELIRLKKGSDTTSISRNQANTIVNKYKETEDLLKRLSQEQSLNESNQKDFRFMDTILYGMDDGKYKTMSVLEKAQVFVTTADFWADAWAISKLESVLGIKTIILTDTEDSTCIVKYTEGEVIQPKHYIIMNHTTAGAGHYELVTYKEKGAFEFTELPYDLKIMIIKHCSQKDAGQFMHINEFKQLKYDLGLHEEPADVVEIKYDNLFDKFSTLRFHGRAAKEMPGKSNGDTMSSSYKNNSYFLELEQFIAKDEKRKSWRRMFDDSWTEAQFEVQNKHWASVEHYLMASTFKEQDPELFGLLSLDSKSAISSDLVKAKKEVADRKKNKVKKIHELDPDIIRECRIEALRAKFIQNSDLTTMLVHTKMSKLDRLVQYGSPTEPDIELMKIRKEMKNARENQ